jgi:hypothetical protein
MLTVIPAEAGIHTSRDHWVSMGSRFRGNDGGGAGMTFFELTNYGVNAFFAAFFTLISPCAFSIAARRAAMAGWLAL